MLVGLDLAGGRVEVGRRPEAGRGPHCRGRPLGWGLPEREREEGGGEGRYLMSEV